MKASASKPASKKSKIFISLIIAAFAIVTILGIKFFIESSRTGTISSVQARTKGNPKAPLHIVEFADFQCPACAQGALDLKNFMIAHPDTIHLQMKYFPLAMHRHAILSSQYAECAAQQNAFWPFADLLFERQRVWEGFIDPRPSFELIAKDVKLDLKKLDGCLKDEKKSAIIESDKNEGKALGVASTPTYFINKKMVVGTKSLTQELENFLNEHKK